MSFLRPHQRKTALYSSEGAMHLWDAAIHNGYSALKSGLWSEARRLFGSAYEIAKLRFGLPRQNEWTRFQPSHLYIAAQNLCETLLLLDKESAAQRYLLEQHYQLLACATDKHRDTDQRQQATALLAEAMPQLIASLQRSGDEAQIATIRQQGDQLRQQPPPR